MKLSIFAGDIAEAPAAAICTSTNPRLSLVMGTGASVRARGGFEILRECEAIVAAESARTGRPHLAPGSAWTTGAGALPAKIVIHCVASGETHRSSAEMIRACVVNALARADSAKCRSIAMPLFGTGHASFDFDSAVQVIVEALRGASTGVEQGWIVAQDEEHAQQARSAIRKAFPDLDPEIVRSPNLEPERPSMWNE